MGDTEKVYISIFDTLKKMNIVESFNFIINNDIEIVFYMLTKLFSIIISNAQIYIMVLSIPLNYVVSRLIYKYSKNPKLAYLMFMSLNYFAFSFTLLRHCIALSILFLAFEYLKDRKLKKFIITVLVAGLFHRTAWIFIIAYPLMNFKFDYKQGIAIIFSLIFSVFFGNSILKWGLSLINSEHFAIYSNPKTNTLTFFFINLLILILAAYIINRKKQKITEEEKKEFNDYLNMQTIGVCFSTCTIFISEAFRIATFFSIYSIILLPNAFDLIENKKMKKIILVSTYIVLILYFLIFTINNNSINPYMFFWEK